MFWKRRPAGKNKELNERLQIMKADMENNYKDAAQMDLKRIMQIYETLLAEGKLREKEIDYYNDQIEQAKKSLAHFTHFEGPGTGRFDSGTAGQKP